MILFVLAAMASAQAGEAPAARSASAPAVRTITYPSRDAMCAARLTRTQSAGGDALKKLGELPPGRMILAVEKHVNGCPVNVLPVRDANGQHVMEWAPVGRKVPAPASR